MSQIHKVRAPRVPSSRELPPCPFATCKTVKNIGASTKTRWEYNCSTCHKTWYQTRPDLMQENGWEANVKEAGVRNQYLCSACGLPKRGHKCPRKTPSPFSQGKIYMCGKCGVPKRGHICMKKSIEDAILRMPDKDIESSLLPATSTGTSFIPMPSLPHSSVCDVCSLTIDFLGDDFLSSSVECSVCNARHVHMYCMADMSQDYVCAACADK